MVGQGRMVVAKPGNGAPDRSGDAHPGTLRGRAAAPVPAAEPDGSSQVTDKEIPLGLGLACASLWSSFSSSASSIRQQPGEAPESV
jgi:hypothetical protein